MKLNIDGQILNFDGTPIMDKIKEDGKEKEVPATFRSVIQTALVLEDNEHRLTADKKVYAFQLGTKLFGKKLEKYDLTTDQVSFLKERIGIFFGSVVYGRFCELIGDLKEDKEERKADE